jgi:hypothetical protein
MAESDNNSNAAPTGSLGLKAFNQTGRDDTTTKIIRPKTDPKVRNRNLLLTAVVIVGMCVAVYIAFQRSGLTWEEITREGGSSFGTAPGKEKRSFDGDN